MRLSKYALLGAATIAVFCGWFGYWAFQRAEVLGGGERVAAALRAQGWEALVRDEGVRGFPNRLDTSLADLRVSPPNRAWTWSGDLLRARMLSYRTDHLVLEWPARQEFAAGGERWAVSARPMLSSLVFEDGRLARLSWDAPQLRLRNGETEIAIDRAELHLRPIEGAPPEDGRFAFYFGLEGVFGADLPRSARIAGEIALPGGIGIDGALPDRVRLFRVDQGDEALATRLLSLFGLEPAQRQ